MWKWSRPESNWNPGLRRPLYYPLYYETRKGGQNYLNNIKLPEVYGIFHRTGWIPGGEQVPGADGSKIISISKARYQSIFEIVDFHRSQVCIFEQLASLHRQKAQGIQVCRIRGRKKFPAKISAVPGGGIIGRVYLKQ